jgi:hypothetical protein
MIWSKLYCSSSVSSSSLNLLAFIEYSEFNSCISDWKIHVVIGDS